MRSIRGIIFDKDGTLFDFQATWAEATRRLLSDLSGGDPDLHSNLAEVAGFDTRTGLLTPESVIIAHTLPETAAVLLSAMPAGVTSEFVVERMIASATGVEQVEVVPLAPYFEALRGRELVIGLATNDAERPARRHLEERNILDAFHFVAGYDSGHGAKPAPGQLLAFCAATGLDPDEVVMVGDSRHDLIAGRSAGMGTIGVLTGTARTEDLESHADAVLPHIGHIPGWLDALRAG